MARRRRGADLWGVQVTWTPQILFPARRRDGFRRVGLALAAAACIAAASDPSERLSDPTQEARARTIFREVRCLVCQNESIDDSEAELAADLRRLVREQVAAGRSDAEVRAYLVQRYGQFVLLKPSGDAANLPLWLAPLAVVVLGGGGLLALWRRRREDRALDPDEEARLAALSRTEDS